MFIDTLVVFRWTHGSAAFQLVSGATVHFMRFEGYKMFPYIDDYILVTSAEAAFQHISNLLNSVCQ